MLRTMLPILLLSILFAGPVSAQPVRPQGSDPGSAKVAPAPEDPYLWLENVTGEKPLQWVKQRNAESQAELKADPGFSRLNERLLSILDSKERIPYVEKLGDRLYNFWRDEKNERGLWRRTTAEEYRKPDPAWETVLDVDRLGKEEKENWVWEGSSCLEPEYRRCLLFLSRGGADAVVVREFDLVDRAFVKGGFFLLEAKSATSWVDQDTLFVGTDFGPGSLTTSGYPRQVKRWKRGNPLAAAELIFEGRPDDVTVVGIADLSLGNTKELVRREISTFSNEFFVLLGGKLVLLDVPRDVELSTHRENLFMTLRTDWIVGGKSYPAGALLAVGFDDFLRGSREFAVLFQPQARRSLAGFAPLRDAVIVNELDNVKSRLFVWERIDGTWMRRPVPGLPDCGSITAWPFEAERSNNFWLTEQDFTTPTTLLLGTTGKDPPEKQKSLPAFFDSAGLEVSQHEAVSKDGTKIPYFLVIRKDAPRDGQLPTLLYGYGGFEISMTPVYSGGRGAAWLEQGYAYALANIRGGGEFGPQWHQAALKGRRHKAYEDFVAVAEDLVKSKVTSPRRLGIVGGSNGGLLVGNALTLRPDLFGAVVCQAPLLDMRRYSKLLAGASWMEEYGDPDDPRQWAFLSTISPYHNVKPKVRYPRVFFTTSTRDDRVHPGHSRKMVAKMKDQGLDVLYFENTEGGHGLAATNKQKAFMDAMSYTFLRRQLTGK